MVSDRAVIAIGNDFAGDGLVASSLHDCGEVGVLFCASRGVIVGPEKVDGWDAFES